MVRLPDLPARNTRHFSRPGENLEYMITRGYYERGTFDQYTMDFIRDLYRGTYANSAGENTAIYRCDPHRLTRPHGRVMVSHAIN